MGVAGLTIAWVDNNGITRSRTVPTSRLAAVARAGVGITMLFAVFNSQDGITFEHEGIATASGDVRLRHHLGLKPPRVDDRQPMLTAVRS